MFAKLTIKPLTPFITELESDTIFGHFCWGVYYLFGEEKLKGFLKDFESKPFIVFSNGFKSGFLPKPYLKPYIPNIDELKDAKRLKKISQIPSKILFDNIDDLKDEKIFEALRDTNLETKGAKSIVVQKNSINRATNIVDKGLYSIKKNFFENEFDIYMRFDKEKIGLNEIKGVFDFISKRGYGKDKSAGKGRFEIVDLSVDFKEKEFFTKKRDFYITLSNTFKSKNMKLIYGKTKTKFPKNGGYLSIYEPFKNPCIFYLPGSIFVAGDGVLGRASDKVYKEGYYQSGYSIGIYANGVEI